MNLEEQNTEWFVIHDGKHFGPVSVNDLRYEATLGRLHPQNDMLWKSGLPSWIPAGTLEQIVSAPAAIPAKRPQFVTQQSKEHSKRNLVVTFLLWISFCIFLLAATSLVLMVALPKEHQLRVKLYEGIDRVEAIWQKR
jgi:Na+/proline symporter